MSPELRDQVRAILPLLYKEGGRLTFHHATDDDLNWAERELGGRRTTYAAPVERSDHGVWLTVTVEESVTVDLRLDIVARPRIVDPGDPVLATVTAAFDRDQAGHLLWCRGGDGVPPWG